jgi:hypothetical protein
VQLVLLLVGLAAILLLLVVVWRMHRSTRFAGSQHRLRHVSVGDRCPACGAGTIYITSGQRGEFLGCSQYRNGTGCRAAWDLTGMTRIRGANLGRLS